MPQGNYSAYSQQYGRGPVDVAGKVGAQVTQGIKDKQVRDDKLAKEQKDEELRLEKEKQAKSDKNAKLYGDATAKIIDTQDAPPSAQEISITAGDEIYRLSKSGLEGIDLMRAIDKVTKDSNAAIQGITSAAEAKTNAPKDAFYTDGEFGASNDQMMDGDFAFTFKDGRGQFVGNGNDYTVGEYNGMRGKTLDIPQINMADSTEALNGLRQSQEWNLTTPQGYNAYKKAAGEQANGLISPANATAATRWMYNNAENIGLAGDDKKSLLDAGRVLADGGKYENLSPEQKTLFDKYSGPAREMYSNGLTKNLAKPKYPNNGRGGSGSKDDQYESPKDFVKNESKFLDESFSSEEASAAADDVIENDDFTSFQEAYPDFDLDYDGLESIGASSKKSGDITLGGETRTFSSPEELKEILVNAVQGANAEKVQYYENKTYLENNNLGEIVDYLNVDYRGEGYSFDISGEDIQITKGTKKINFPAAKLGSLQKRKDALKIIINNL